MLYFEAGVLPARFQIKRIKVVFYQYILNQNKNSLLYQFLKAQKDSPKQGDWFSEVQSILDEFEMKLSKTQIKETLPQKFKVLAKEKAVSAAIKYLNSLQKKKEKGARIKYDSLELKDYLNSWSNLNIEDQRIIFSIRSEMNPLKSNFRRNNKMEVEYCVKKCGQEIDNEHLTWCKYMNEESEFKYMNILNGDLEDKIYTYK